MSTTPAPGTSAQSISVGNGSDGWRKEAQKTLNQVAKLKKILRIKAEELEKAKKANKDAKLIRQKQVLRKAGAALREAVNKLNGQLERQMKMQCRSFCEAMHETLPQELRDMFVRHIVTDRNVTFFTKDNTISVANGTSPKNIQHCFDAEYTGTSTHLTIMTELAEQGARFDFRARHELLGKVFEYYAALETNFNLVPKIKKVGIVLMERYLANREVMLSHLADLLQFPPGVEITFFIETVGGSRVKIARAVRRILASSSRSSNASRMKQVIRSVSSPTWHICRHGSRMETHVPSRPRRDRPIGMR